MRTLDSTSATSKQCHAVCDNCSCKLSFIYKLYARQIRSLWFVFCVCVCVAVSSLQWVYLKTEVLFNGCESKGWTQDCHGVIGRRNTGGCWFTMIAEFISNHLRSVFMSKKKGRVQDLQPNKPSVQPCNNQIVGGVNSVSLSAMSAP